MKTKQTISLLAALVLSASAVVAKPIVGPKGGRILTEDAPHVEFLMDANRYVVISFYDADLKAVPVGEQVAVVMAEAPSGKVKLELVMQDGSLISTARLPAGEGYRIVVQIRADPSAKPVNHRFEFHSEVCGGCDRAEYACVCDDHGEQEHSGHVH